MNLKYFSSFWMTLIWGVVIGFLLAVGQIVPMFLYTLFGDAPMSLSSLRQQMGLMDSDAFLLAITAIGSTLFIVPFILLMVKISNREVSLKEFFAFNSFSKKDFLIWMAVAIGVLVVQDYILHLAGIKAIPDSMLKIAYPSDSSKWLLLLGVAIFAPFLEELIFRGFLLKRFAHTFMGPDFAIVLTAAIWAIIHFQYEPIYLLIIFFIGIILGYARAFSNSLYIPILMHMLFNLVAGVELYLVKGIL